MVHTRTDSTGPPPRRYRFAEFELDARSRVLSRNDRPIGVEPRVFSLLLYLIERAGTAVSRADLFETLWQGAAVTGSSLDRAISKARRALAPHRDMIRTVHGFGYEFTQHVELERPPRTDSPTRLEPSAAGPATEIPAIRRGAPLDPVVGRRAEQDRFERLLRFTAHSNGGRLLFVGGEPGIGKTRLCEDFAERAQARRIDVFRASAAREGAGGALSLFGDVFAQLRTRCDAREWKRATDGLDDEAERWLRDPLGLTPECFGDAFEAIRRGRWVEQIARVLLGLARDRHSVLILEDLQWTDASSLALVDALHHQIGTTRLLIVATARTHTLAARPPERDTHVGPERLAGLIERVDRDHRFELDPLSRSEIGQLARNVAMGAPGPPPSRAELDRLHARSGGNPLFARELVRLLVERRDRTSSKMREPIPFTRLPSTVQEAARDRFEFLPADCRSALEVAAIVGLQFEASLVADVIGRPLEALARDLAIAERAAVIHVERLEAGRFCFAHDLLREALLENRSAIARAALHARVAERLDDRGPEQRAALIEALALHWDAALLAGHGERAIRAHREAGEHAGRLWDFEGAARHAERAAELVALERGARDRERFRCRLEMGQAWLAAGEFERARGVLESLAEESIDTPFRSLGIEAIAALAFRNVGNTGDVPHARLATARRLAAAQPADDETTRALLEACLSLDGYWESWSEADALSRIAVERCARGPSDARAGWVRLFALSSRERFTQHPERRAEALEVARERLRLARTLRAPLAELHAHYSLLTIALQTIRATDVETHAREIRAIATRTRHPEALRIAQLVEFELDLIAGSLGDWESPLERILTDLARWRPKDESDLLAATQLAFFHAIEGRLDELLPAFDACVVDAPTEDATGDRTAEAIGVHFRLGRALARLQGGNATGARDDLVRALAACPNGFRPDWTQGMNLMVAAWVACALGERALCRQLVEWVRPLAGSYLTLESATVFGAADRLLAALYRTLGEHALAVRAGERAVASEQTLGRGVLLAWSRFELARALEARDGAGDATRAKRLRTEAEGLVATSSIEIAGIRDDVHD